MKATFKKCTPPWGPDTCSKAAYGEMWIECDCGFHGCLGDRRHPLCGTCGIEFALIAIMYGKHYKVEIFGEEK